jgi:hypothetical protein
VNRRFILAALMAMLLAACGTQTGSSEDADATLTPEAATAEATASPSDEAAASEDDNGGTVTGSLDDIIPDEVNGVAGTALPGMEQIFSAALQGQGLNAGEAEFAFVTYGDDADATALTAWRIPGMTDVQMEMLARVMSGVDTGGEAEIETEDIGGKTVISFKAPGTDTVAFLYIADNTAFTIAGPDQGFAEQLLAELP